MLEMKNCCASEFSIDSVKMQLELDMATAAKGTSKLEMCFSDGWIKWKMSEEAQWKELLRLEDIETAVNTDRIADVKINYKGELVFVYDSGEEINLGATEGIGLSEEQKQQLQDAYSHSQNDAEAQPLSNLEIEALIKNIA